MKKLLLITLLLGLIYFAMYPNTLVKPTKVTEEQGRIVLIKMPNGVDIKTHESYLVEEDGKVFYRGKHSEIDLTGSVINYIK